MNDKSVSKTAPEFLRFPRTNERCPLSGLSRSFLYGLAEAGDIQTISLRQRNKARGVRLIVADSLLAWIRKHAEAAQ